jgi:VWFA-related protein
MRNWIRTIALVLLIGGLIEAQQPAPGQTDQPQATFRADVNYVEVDVHVTDERGNPVTGLAREDFEVLENGTPQVIGVFSGVTGRVEPPPPDGAPEPDTASNFRPFDGRLYVLVFDDLHTEVQRSPAVRAAARRFIEQYIGANDMAAIVSTSGRLDASQEVTRSKRLLLAAADKFQGRKLRSATLERRDEFQSQTQSGRSLGFDSKMKDPYDAERGFRAQNALETIRNVATWLARVQGTRRALVVVGEGIDYNIYDVFDAPYATSIIDDARRTIAAATRANVNIYAIDPRGLGMDTVDGEITGISQEPNPANTGIQNLLREAQFGQDSLRVLADETGGLAFVNTNDLNGAFDSIVRDNTNYYVIGFRSTDQRRDGKFRKLEVRVKKPGLRVRARRGYVAERPPAGAAAAAPAAANTSAALREVLDNPLPVSGLGLTAATAVFRGAGEKASVLLTTQVDGRRLTFADQGGVFRDDVEVALVAVNDQGKAETGDRRIAELKLKPETHKIVSRTGIRMLSRLELPPGRYQLRLGARETGKGAAGSVLHDLVVPKFDGSAPTLSGVVVASKLGGIIPTLQPDPEMREVLPGPPTADRDFIQADTLWAFVEIYKNDKSPAAVNLSFTLTGENGASAFRTEDRIEPSSFENSRRAYGYRAEIPLGSVAPGAYVLRVEAGSGSGEPDVRAVPLRVHPTPAGSAPPRP